MTDKFDADFITYNISNLISIIVFKYTNNNGKFYCIELNTNSGQWYTNHISVYSIYSLASFTVRFFFSKINVCLQINRYKLHFTVTRVSEESHTIRPIPGTSDVFVIATNPPCPVYAYVSQIQGSVQQ